MMKVSLSNLFRFRIFRFIANSILLLQLGNLEPALASCDKAIALEPTNSKAFLRKGMVLVQQGNLDLARQTLTAGQALDPSNKSFSTWIAKCGEAGPAAAPNTQLGKCDEALSSIFEAHGQQGYPLIETVCVSWFGVSL